MINETGYRPKNSSGKKEGVSPPTCGSCISPPGPDPVEQTDQGGLHSTIATAFSELPAAAMLEVGKVLKQGRQRYGPGNIEKLDIDTHLDHALEHLFFYLSRREFFQRDPAAIADGQRDLAFIGLLPYEELSHAVCRLLFVLELLIQRKP